MAGDESVGSFAVDLGEWFQAHAAQIKENLERYFLGEDGPALSGRHFERFSAMGNPNRFEATDILAVEALSVGVHPNSAAKLLDTEAEDFNSLLRQIPANLDMWQVPRLVLADDSPASVLYERLKDLHDVGPVTASKLLASKRPRLIPVKDSLVSQVLQPPDGRFWLPMYDQLLDDHRRKQISSVVSLPLGEVSLLRRIDVAVWMHARGSGGQH